MIMTVMVMINYDVTIAAHGLKLCPDFAPDDFPFVEKRATVEWFQYLLENLRTFGNGYPNFKALLDEVCDIITLLYPDVAHDSSTPVFQPHSSLVEGIHVSFKSVTRFWIYLVEV